MLKVEKHFNADVHTYMAAKFGWGGGGGFLGQNRPKLPLYRPKIGRPPKIWGVFKNLHIWGGGVSLVGGGPPQAHLCVHNTRLHWWFISFFEN